MPAKLITIEVAYAQPEKQKILQLEIEPDTPVLQAVEKSGILQEFPEINLEEAKMGVFGKAIKHDSYVLQEGDRIEIYRPLLVDPKQSRKDRAAKAQATKPA